MMKRYAVLGLLCWWIVNGSSVLAIGIAGYVKGGDWSQMDHRERAAYVSGFLETLQGVNQREAVEGFLGLGVPISSMTQGTPDANSDGQTDRKHMTDAEHAARVNGVVDAERSARLQEGMAWSGVEISEVVKALNTYYADARRRGLPVSLALVFLHSQVAGVDSRRAQELTN